MIVQDVDCKEQEDIYQPAADGNFVWSEEVGRSIPVELWDISGCCHEKELDESQESSFKN